MTYSEARKAWYDALVQVYEARSNVHKVLKEKGYETETEREDLQELLMMSDKLVAVCEADDKE